MPDHIVIVLHPSQSMCEAYRHLQVVLPGVKLEPQFHGLPPAQVGEAAVLSEMQRTIRFVCLPGVDPDTLVRRLQAEPLVEHVYHERQAEPAGSP